ncbi:MAG: ABC transporter substrate-binding protein [Gammaproteobacteria bacterium]|jgi:phospholipid transport system substrate-binding protein|nr:ABC transporter substrate-binding protein [Gammaproteobacteria bacterium]
MNTPMPPLSSLAKALLALTLLTLVLPLAAQSDAIDYSAEPVELVRVVSEELFERIDRNRAIYKDDQPQLEQMIRDVFLPLLNERFSARLILGKHSRGLSDQQINDFASALMNQLLASYAKGLLDFKSHDQVEVLPLRGENTERMTRVQTRILMDSGEKAPVDYVLRKFGDRWQAFDVIIEGISYVATYRNQFNEEISRDGFDQVLQRLQKGELQLEKVNEDE